ncbi:MAG TPA: PD-(D/E)XK nuclease family protein, partial [Acidimicrobiales bacterium]
TNHGQNEKGGTKHGQNEYPRVSQPWCRTTRVQLFDDRAYADPDLIDPLDDDEGLPRHLSPSSASTYDSCPRRWRFRYVDRLPDPPGEPALAGTFAHRVLELLFQLPPAERTIEQAKRIAREVWPSTERDPNFQALGLDERGARAFRWKGWRAIEGLWALEDPTTVDVHATEHHVVTTVGDVPFRGIVDRLDRAPDGSLEVTDYKSGRAPSVRFSDDRLSQVLLYAAAVHAVTDERPRRARLLYLGQRVIDVEVTDAALEPVVESLHSTWRSLRDDLATGEFEPRPGPLCGWCPFADRCSEGSAEIQRRYDLGVLHDDAPAVPVVLRAS